MTAKKDNDRIALDRLAAFHIEEILDVSEEALLADLSDEGENSTEAINAAKGVFERASAGVAKQKFAEAKKAVAAYRERSRNIVNLDPATARRRLEEILAAEPETRKKLTLAARNDKGLSDGDVQGMLEDLAELGLLPDNDRLDDES